MKFLSDPRGLRKNEFFTCCMSIVWQRILFLKTYSSPPSRVERLQRQILETFEQNKNKNLPPHSMLIIYQQCNANASALNSMLIILPTVQCQCLCSEIFFAILAFAVVLLAQKFYSVFQINFHQSLKKSTSSAILSAFYCNFFVGMQLGGSRQGSAKNSSSFT